MTALVKTISVTRAPTTGLAPVRGGRPRPAVGDGIPRRQPVGIAPSLGQLGDLPIEGGTGPALASPHAGHVLSTALR